MLNLASITSVSFTYGSTDRSSRRENASCVWQGSRRRQAKARPASCAVLLDLQSNYGRLLSSFRVGTRVGFTLDSDLADSSVRALWENDIVYSSFWDKGAVLSCGFLSEVLLLCQRPFEQDLHSTHHSFIATCRCEGASYVCVYIHIHMVIYIYIYIYISQILYIRTHIHVFTCACIQI